MAFELTQSREPKEASIRGIQLLRQPQQCKWLGLRPRTYICFPPPNSHEYWDRSLNLVPSHAMCLCRGPMLLRSDMGKGKRYPDHIREYVRNKSSNARWIINR